MNQLKNNFPFAFLQLIQSTIDRRSAQHRRKMKGTVMEKSMRVIFLQLIGAMIVCGLSVAGTGSASNIMSSSLNPYSSSTSGAVLSSSSTTPSMLETYLQTFPINEHQNIITTIYHASARHPTSTMSFEKEKPTTSSVASISSSTTNVATEASQSSSPAQNTQTPFLISTGSSTAGSSMTTSVNLSENLEQQVLISTGPILLGCGPNNREGIGIQKALDWLREKRVSDFGWENDTHMVILAKEVSGRGDVMGLLFEFDRLSLYKRCLIPNTKHWFLMI